MISVSRILKADLCENGTRRVRWGDLSEPDTARGDASDFEPLTFPAARSPRLESHAGSGVPSALAALQSAAEQVLGQRDHWLDQSQQEAVRLGLAIAERLLRRTLAVEPSAILDLIRSAIDWSGESDQLRVRLHPADAELVTATSAAHRLESNRDLEFVADDSLVRGDCLVESQSGQTDARLEVILQRIAEELLAD